MREILFRGKKADKWEYGNLEVFSDDVVFIRYNSGHFSRVIPETVGQFTGKIDKNGNKIFEGDILSGHWNTVCVIAWDYCRAGFVADAGTRIADIDYYFSVNGEKVDAEVIGNIYDNPELIKQCGGE